MAVHSFLSVRMWNIKGISSEQDPVGINEIKLLL